MKRRAITNEDLHDFVKMLRQWEVVENGPLNWQSYIKHIEMNIETGSIPTGNSRTLVWLPAAPT